MGDSIEVSLKLVDSNAGEIIFSRVKCKEYSDEEEKGKKKIKTR